MRSLARIITVAILVLLACFFAAQIISSLLSYKSPLKPWLILASCLGIFILAMVKSGISDDWHSLIASMPECLRLVIAGMFPFLCTFFALGFCAYFDLSERIVGIMMLISFFGSIIFAAFLFNDRSAFIPDQICFDLEKITRTLHDGSSESVRWDELKEILILTTNRGPWEEDVFFVLSGGETGCIIPSNAKGFDDLFTHISQLPGFDNGVVIRAMGSTSNNKFLCWKKEEGDTKQSDEAI